MMESSQFCNRGPYRVKAYGHHGISVLDSRSHGGAEVGGEVSAPKYRAGKKKRKECEELKQFK